MNNSKHAVFGDLAKIQELKGKDLVAHFILYVIGVFIMPLGVVFTINAHIGAGGYDALNFALADKLGIRTSYAIYMTAFLAVILAAVIRKTVPNILTFVTSFFMGLSTDFWKMILKNVQAESIPMGIVFTAIGMLIVGFSVAAYVISYFPSNPTDDLMVALSERKIRLSTAKISMDVICVILAFLLGGEIGIGTIVVTVGLGFVVDFFHGCMIKWITGMGIKTSGEEK